MKNTLKVLVLLTLMLASFKPLLAQEIVKVTYVTSPLSAKIIDMLKSQIKDPNQFSALYEKASKAKILSSLYFNRKTGEVFFKDDSVHIPSGISTTGYTKSVYKTQQKDFVVREIFLKADVLYVGKVSDLKWKIESESKMIGKYNCKKATLINSPDVTVWFTNEIPFSAGPNFYYGLPGLVLEADNFFEKITFETISFLKNDGSSNKIFDQIKSDLKSSNSISLSEVILRKNNFIQKVINQTKSKAD